MKMNTKSNLKYTREVVADYMKKEGCELIGDYVNGETKTRIRCRCGHETTVSFFNFKYGIGRYCPACQHLRHRVDSNVVKEYFKSEGCELLDEYENSHKLMTYRCRCGHLHKIGYTTFRYQKIGRICPKCANKILPTLEEMREYLKKEGCTLLTTEPLKNAKGIIRYIARCGHETTSNWNNFKTGQSRKCKWCCKPRINFDDFIKLMESRNCKMLSTKEDYKNARSKVRYIAACGHENVTTWQTFAIRKFDTMCPRCTRIEKKRLGENKLREILASIYGEDDIEKEYPIKTTTLNTRPQYIDFYIKSINLAVEYNGHQHYEYVPVLHHNDMNEFIDQLQRDERKRKYCKEHNINLLEIDGRKHNHRNMTVEKIKKMLLPYHKDGLGLNPSGSTE